MRRISCWWSQAWRAWPAGVVMIARRTINCGRGASRWRTRCRCARWRSRISRWSIARHSGYSGWLTLPGSRAVQSFIGAPIRFKRKLLGFINLESATAGFFKAEYADRLQVFANQAAAALENARLYQLEQEEVPAGAADAGSPPCNRKKWRRWGGWPLRWPAPSKSHCRPCVTMCSRPWSRSRIQRRYQKQLQNVGREIERLDHITRSVLSFTRPEPEAAARDASAMS